MGRRHDPYGTSSAAYAAAQRFANNMPNPYYFMQQVRIQEIPTLRPHLVVLPIRGSAERCRWW